METPMVILSIVLVVVIYVLYQHFQKKKTKLGKARILGDGGNEKDNKYMKFEKLANPSSPNYYILYWLYLEHINHNNFPSGTNHIELFKLDSNGIIVVNLHKNGSLYYNTSGDTTQRVIVNSFPLQKWCCLVISVDSNKTVDCYLDGKLVRSHKEATALTSTSKSTEIIENTDLYTEDDSRNIIYVGAVEREPVTMDPGKAWNKYTQGNGGNFITKMFSQYGVALRFSKDNEVKGEIAFPP